MIRDRRSGPILIIPALLAAAIGCGRPAYDGSSRPGGNGGGAASSGGQGGDGATGDGGTSGAAGATGIAGTTGAGGMAGTTGAGAGGVAGSTGVAGSGAGGIAGSTGVAGNGAGGVAGSTGVAGSGAGGVAGVAGSGAGGVTGSAGTTGLGGVSGTAGSTGTAGRGTTGVAGTTGAGGVSGAGGIVGAAGSMGGGPAAGTGGTTPSNYRLTCDGSMAVMIDATHFLDGNDEQQAMRVYTRGAAGTPLSTFDVSTGIGLATGDEADFEDAARIGDRVYVISSHSRNKNGKLERTRYRFFAMDIAGAVPAHRAERARLHRAVARSDDGGRELGDARQRRASRR